MIDTAPDALVRYREREWVFLPTDDPNLVLLRPIGGSSREVCGVVRPLADLMAYEAPHERIEPAAFEQRSICLVGARCTCHTSGAKA